MIRAILTELLKQPLLYYLPIILILIGAGLKILSEPKISWEKLYVSYDITFGGITSLLIYLGKVVDDAAKVPSRDKDHELTLLLTSVSHGAVLFIAMLGFLVIELLTEKSFRLKEEAYKDKKRNKPKMYDVGKVAIFGFLYNFLAIYLLIKLEETIGV